MSKLNYDSNKDNILNSRIKSQLNEKRIREIRKTLLSLIEIEIKTSKSDNVIVIKKDENENRMAAPTIIPRIYYQEDFEKVNQSKMDIENETDLDTSELADSSDFENEEDDF